MQTEIKAPAAGIEVIGPTDAVIENPGARTARTVEVMPIAAITSVSRQNFDSDLRDTPSLRATMANNASTTDVAPSEGGALIGR
jgi:hypothetical protein